MRCVVLLLFVELIFCCFGKDIDLRITPVCIINFGYGEQPCAYFKERSLDKLLEESWTEQSVNHTSNGYQYTNISILYTRKTEMSSVLVMIRYDHFPLPEQTWEIQPMGKELPDSPLLITIAYAPTPANFTKYQMRRIVNPTRLLEDPACNKTETTNECKYLKNSKLYMRKSRWNTLSITLSSHLTNSALSVEVLSANCNITCRGDINPCSGVDIRNMKWENPLEELKIYNSNNNSSPTYYCARISPADHECCMIYTETILMHTDSQRNPSVIFSQKLYLPEFCLIIALIFFIVVMILLRKMFGASSYKCWRYYTLGSQESVEDVLLNSSNQDDNSPSKVSMAPGRQLHAVEVLLIYPKESDEIEKLMAKFRYILSFYVTKIWDPFDELEIEKVSENPSIWLENVLSRDQVKVILVENNNTIEYLESCFSSRPTVHYHHLDVLFFSTISILQNNPYLSHNYQRLFIIRFSSIKLNIKSTNIVPCTRYEIPQNVGNLITDLVGPHINVQNHEFKPPLEEIKELEQMVNEYKQDAVSFSVLQKGIE